jgi:hypothetical protein
MARYKVIGPDVEDMAHGLSLEEAFARMMALAGTECIFSRHKGTLLLHLTRTRPFVDLPFLDPDRPGDRELLRSMWPLYQSDIPDDADARRELMLQAIKRGRDNYFAREESLQAVVQPPVRERIKA